MQEEFLNVAIKLYEDGMSLQKIAHCLSVSSETVRFRLTKAGKKLRGRGRYKTKFRNCKDCNQPISENFNQLRCRKCREGKSRKNPGSAGQKHWNSKLTDKQVNEIRRLHRKGQSGKSLAKRFGVACSTISAIANGKSRASN